MSKFFIISGPSGAGEDSIIAGLEEFLDFEKVVTTTTRKMRPGESQGNPYYFISREEFEKGISENKFIEHAVEDGGNYYGGTYEEIERAKKSEKPAIWKVDYQGVMAGKKLFPDTVSILIYIPMELIEKRLRLRDSVTEEYIKGRLEHAKGWYANENLFDYKVENEEGKLDETIDKVAKIIKNNTSS